MNIIYVLKSSAYGDNPGEYIDLIKIGFSDNWSKREASYKNHNPTVKVLFEISGGTREIESLLHIYFKKFQYKDYGREWFYFNDEIIDFFKTNTTIDDIISAVNVIPLSLPRSLRKVLKEDIKSKFSHILISTVRIKNVNILDDLFKFQCSTPDQVMLYLEQTFSNEDVNKIIEDSKAIKSSLISCNAEILEFQGEFEKEKTFQKRLKCICEFQFSSEVSRDCILCLLPINYRSFYVTLGLERCRSLGYNLNLLKKDLNVSTFDLTKVKDSILQEFLVGEKISSIEIRSKLKIIYDQLNYSKTVKANDLEDYFELKPCKVKDPSGKWVHGFEIISLRP